MKKLLLILSLLLIPNLAWAVSPPARIYTYTTGQAINPDEVTANEDAIFTYLNRDTEEIADNAVTTSKILDGTIVNADISSTAAIGYSKLNLSGSVTAGDLASTTVTSDSYTNTDLTVDADGRITSASSGTVALTSEVSGTLPIANGGTGSTSTTYCTLTTNVTGTLPVANGGTGATTLTDGGILLGSGTGAITALGVATNGQIPIGDGTTDPVLATISGTADEIDITNGAGTITIGLVNPLAVAKGGTGATAAANAANGVAILDASGYLPNDSVDTTALKTATGEVSATTQAFNFLTLPGGTYGFYPQIKTSDTGDGCLVTIGGVAGVGTGPDIQTYATIITIYNPANVTTSYAQQRYVTASGEDTWVFLLLDKNTKEILSAYQAPDHPAYGNGGDFDKVPHPFGSYDETKHEIILLDKETCNALKLESEQTGKSILTLVNENYKPNISNEVYQSLHSGKFLTENKEGKQIQVRQMVETLPTYIKVRKLSELTQADKDAKEVIRQQRKQESDTKKIEEDLIQAKIREQSIKELKKEGKLDSNGNLIK